MNLQELDRILEKYYEGSSSEEEERLLFDALKDDNLPDKYIIDRQMAGISSYDSFIPEPDSGFESRIMQAIDDNEQDTRVRSLKRRVYSVVSVAATILIVISSWFILQDKNGMKDSYDDPVLAYNATIGILQQVSSTMNTGNKAIAKLNHIDSARENLKRISEPSRLLTREMEALKYIEKSISLLETGKAGQE
jgi:hypothetical protein